MTNRKKRESVAKARARVLKEARRRGSITNARARDIGEWDQAWYHLNEMRKAGLLKKTGFNMWRAR